MNQISGNKLKSLFPLLHEDKLDYPIIMSILEGAFSGYAIVDDSDNPKKAIVIHRHIGFILYLGDEPDPHESQEIAGHILNYRSDRSYCNWVELAHCPPSVEKLIFDKHPSAKSYDRISWNHDPSFLQYAEKPSLPDGFSVGLLNKTIFRNEFLRKETEMFWDSVDVFLENSFGTVVLDGNKEFMGVCGAVSAMGDFLEINIEVKAEVRRKGIGYAVAYRYIEECYKRGKIPHWDCYEHNQASQALAKKLGFSEAGRYPLISWEY